MAGHPPGKSKRRGFGRITTAGGQFGKRPAPPPPPASDDPLAVQEDNDEPQLDGIGEQEDKGSGKDDSSGSEHSNGTPEDVMCDGATQGQARCRKKDQLACCRLQRTRLRSERARPKGTTPGGPGRGKTKMTIWARMVTKGSKGARREARLENTKEQREKRRSAEEKRAARAAAPRERKKIYTEARAALLQRVHQLKLDTIVEHPEEALSTDSKKGQAYRQAYAILFFVSLEYFLLRIF